MVLLVGVALLPRVTSAQLAACRADREQYCKGVALGGGRVLRCLEEHRSSLSEGCRQVIGTMAPAGGSGPARSPAAQACHDDAVRFCRDAAGDRAKIRSCLQAHADQLSDGCKSALASLKKE